MKLLSYDIEIVDELPEDMERPDLSKITPSVAALAAGNKVRFYYDKPYMTVDTAKQLVITMLEAVDKGWTIFGWNVLGFDFPLLGYYSGMIDECATLALNSVDPMFIVVCVKGHYLSLDKALAGAGLETKTHKVTLNDGTAIDDMSGKLAPELWRRGEYEAVKTYLRGDVVQPLKLGYSLQKTNIISWTSNSGRLNYLNTRFLKVKECFDIPLPDTSWMTSAPSRESCYSWIPRKILEKEI